MTDQERQNRLAAETSPYLLQHADNPVDWHPWNDAALQAARDSGKPLLLSIGYSACHWCHVMAHESFEDEATAKLMNERFVNVKVDREERPDLDRIYQTAHQLLTQRPGGWPLTMFINPEDQRPFFGGTYFPKDARYGMPAFSDLLQRVADYYDTHRDDIRKQGEQLRDIFAQLDPQPPAGDVALDSTPLAEAREKFEQQFDREFGGLGGAPKFPHPATVERLLRHWRAGAHGAEPDVGGLYLVTLTLKRMADGGIYDQLGGGFCRYSVDRAWQIPHFEKMLYDNGPLLALYADVALATGDGNFRRVAGETADWMLRRMRAGNGGFCASLDADSEGEEGRYYAWTPDTVRAIVGADDYDLVARYYGLDDAANFEGQWHLTVREDLDSLANQYGAPPDELRRTLERARSRLLEARRTRVPPARDDKELTSWNALAIRGLARAARALERADLVDAASDAVDFVRASLLVDGRLRASFKDGQARHAAYLDDHAFLLDALLELLQCRWRTSDLAFAIELAELMLAHFEDGQDGGFWFTADDHEALMHRPKQLADEALPAGNGVGAFALQRLGFLLGEARYLNAAERTLRCAWQAICQLPHVHVSLLNTLEEYLEYTEIVVIRGTGDELSRWREETARVYAPRRLVFAIADDAAALPGALAERAPRPGETVAYHCVGTRCSLPLTSLEELAGALSGS